MAANYNNLLVSSNIKTNYIRNIQSGITTNDNGDSIKIYQIALDIDSYIDNITSEIIDSDDSLYKLITNINEITFDLFKKSLHPDFFKELQQENYIESDFRGII